MGVRLGSPWDGKTVPHGQQRTLLRGGEARPPLTVGGLPARTAVAVPGFNDRSYGPSSENGGHATIGLPVAGKTGKLPTVPSVTSMVADGAKAPARAKSSGQFQAFGDLPPCSGGKGHRYVVEGGVRSAPMAKPSTAWLSILGAPSAKRRGG